MKLFKRIRAAFSRGEPATLIAFAALVVALGGTAYAMSLDKNSVKSKQVKDGSLKFKDTGFTEEISTKLDFGQSKVIAKHGTLKLRARCLENTTSSFGDPNQDVLRVTVETTKDGAVFNGSVRKDGASPADFLDTNTPEAERLWEELAVPTGESLMNVEDETQGFAIDNKGKKSILMGSLDQAYLVGLYGSDCLFKGSVQYLR